MTYDYIIAGAGLFGSVVARELAVRGKRVLVIDKRPHIGGNCYTEAMDGINVHMYGAHIFRTSKLEIWNYIRQFADFNHFINSPIALYHGKAYNMLFNMNTFNRIWGAVTLAEVKAKIEEQRKGIVGEPKNLDRWAAWYVSIYGYARDNSFGIEVC